MVKKMTLPSIIQGLILLKVAPFYRFYNCLSFHEQLRCSSLASTSADIFPDLKGKSIMTYHEQVSRP